jgi:hypothetical protein
MGDKLLGCPGRPHISGQPSVKANQVVIVSSLRASCFVLRVPPGRHIHVGCIQHTLKFTVMMKNTQGKLGFQIETESIKIPHKTHTMILCIMLIL